MSLALAVAGFCHLAVFGQQLPGPGAEQPYPAGVDDTPGAGVARLSLINGDVTVRRGDSGEVVAAAMNQPLMAGDVVLTGPMSRAEIQFDAWNMIRLGAGADVRLAELEFHRYMVQMAAGTATFRVMRNNDASIEVGTPSVAMRPSHRGMYRIAVRPDGTTEILIREGDLDVYGPKGSENVRAGQMMMVRGEATDPEFQVLGAAAEDDWDRWNRNRDIVIERSEAARYVNPEIYGAEDLDGQGRWVNNPSYGQVWSPTVNPDWAPYRNGRWVWEDYYGWTWVSYDSWGWAPYHYGRWFWDSLYGWCWWPGARTGHVYYRPALVGFFGFGGVGVGVGGFGFGHVGWVPLAPYEPFHPWWGRGIYGGYRTGALNATVVTGNVNIANVYRNARVVNGATGMPAGRFGNSGVSSRTMVPVTRTDLAGAGLVRGQLPVSPTRSSLHATDRMPTRTSAGYGAGYGASSPRIYSTRQPAALNRVPFEQQRSRTEQVYRQPGFGGSGMSNNSSGVAGGWRPAAGSGGTGSAIHPGPPAAGTAQQPGMSSGNGSSGGWRRLEGAGSSPGERSGSAGAPGPGAGERQPMRMSPSFVQTRPTSQPASQPQYRQGPGSSSPGQQQPQYRQPAPSSPGPPPSSRGGGGGGNGGGGHSGGGGGGGGSSRGSSSGSRGR